MHFPAYYELVPNTSNSFNKNEVYSQQVSGELELLCRRCYIVMVLPRCWTKWVCRGGLSRPWRKAAPSGRSICSATICSSS